MKPLQILVIDDHRANLVLVQQLLLKLPACTSTLLQSPVEALEWCRSQMPDLVIVDLMMPDMNGIEFTRRFRQLEGNNDIPILMITANTQMEVRYEALEAGLNDFLTKPINKAEFLPRVKNMLALRYSQKMLADRALLLTEEVRKATAELRAQERETIFRLSKLAEYRDPETGAHIMRMANYSHHIARNMGLSEEEQELILQACPMHDIGKVAIPDHILLKPGKLDPDEFELIKTHATIGHEILKNSPSKMLQASAIIALSHHEKFDGTGYPAGLKGDNIPLYGRITAVADVFDALTSDRPYKRAFDIEVAVDIIRKGDGTHFDPACVRAFFRDWDFVLQFKNSFVDEQTSPEYSL